MMGKNPLDMGQYKKIFGTCRIPHEKRDKLSFNNSKHVTVIHNNHVRLFSISTYFDDNISTSHIGTYLYPNRYPIPDIRLTSFDYLLLKLSIH